MSDFDDKLKESLDGLEDQAANLVKELFGKNGFKTATRELFDEFWDDCGDDLENYARARANGLISESDLDVLVRTKGALLNLTLLTAKGLAEVQAERFRRRFLELVTDTLSMLARRLL